TTLEKSALAVGPLPGLVSLLLRTLPKSLLPASALPPLLPPLRLGFNDSLPGSLGVLAIVFSPARHGTGAGSHGGREARIVACSAAPAARAGPTGAGRGRARAAAGRGWRARDWCRGRGGGCSAPPTTACSGGSAPSGPRRCAPRTARGTRSGRGTTPGSGAGRHGRCAGRRRRCARSPSRVGR